MTLVAFETVTVHEPLPLQPLPLQPANALPVAGVAVKVTPAPAPNDAEHAVPQSIPEGDETTLPVPAPTRLTINGKS